MNTQDFEAHVEQTLKATAHLLVSKGREYAGSLDRLANFKRGAALTGATPLQVAFIYASKHYDAIATHVRAEAAKELHEVSEPIEGRFDDLINYALLMKALVVEGRRESGKPETAPETPARPGE